MLIRSLPFWFLVSLICASLYVLLFYAIKYRKRKRELSGLLTIIAIIETVSIVGCFMSYFNYIVNDISTTILIVNSIVLVFSVMGFCIYNIIREKDLIRKRLFMAGFIIIFISVTFFLFIFVTR